MKTRLAVAGGAVAVLAVTFGLFEMYKTSTVETDNAHVDGNLLTLNAKIDSDVVAVHASENQLVKKGQVLIELDDRHLKGELAQLAAELEANGINYRKTLQQLSVAGAERGAAAAQKVAIQSELQTAMLDMERVRQLAGQKLMSQASLEKARLEGVTTESRIVTKDNELRMIAAKAQLITLEQQSLLAEREKLIQRIALAELELSYKTVRAPKDGHVVSLTVQTGEQITKGSQLVTLLPLDEMWIEANFKETEMERISSSDKVEVTIDAYPGQSFPGRVVGISPIAGAKRSVLPPNYAYGNFTRLIQRVPVRIKLDGLKDSELRILPGLSAKVSIVNR